MRYKVHFVQGEGWVEYLTDDPQIPTFMYTNFCDEVNTLAG